MRHKINETAWLKNRKVIVEADMPPPAGQPDAGPPAPPAAAGAPPADPNAAPAGAAPPAQPQDISGDPQHPDMPEEQEDQDFEQWKREFAKESVKGDPNTLEQMILSVRDQDLEPNPRKFVEDNLQINFLREKKDILIPSQKIRKMITDQLDQNFPAGSIVSYMVEVLNENPLLNQIYIKLLGAYGGRMDYHRKFVAALLGAFQVAGGPRNPNGNSNEDLVLEQKDVSVRISTRFAVRWGEIPLGTWMMNEQDPERYLKGPELERLEAGSPEEKDVLRRRIVVESIAKMFEERAFIINTVSKEGTVGHLGLDLGNCLRAAYVDGKLVMRTKNSDVAAAFIDQDGRIVSIPDMGIYYVKESQELNDRGQPENEELEFIGHRNGTLYLRANADLIKEASQSLQGFVYQETPWTGNPTDLMRVTRCTPTVSEIIMKDCNG